VDQGAVSLICEFERRSRKIIHAAGFAACLFYRRCFGHKADGEGVNEWYVRCLHPIHACGKFVPFMNDLTGTGYFVSGLKCNLKNKIDSGLHHLS